MQPGLDDPAENLFFSKSSCYQRLMPNARTSHRMCGLFEDSLMLSRKTSGARTKNFSCSTLVNSLQFLSDLKRSILPSGHRLDDQNFWKTIFAVPIYMLRRGRTDVFKPARLKTMARPTNSFCFLERVNGNIQRRFLPALLAFNQRSLAACEIFRLAAAESLRLGLRDPAALPPLPLVPPDPLKARIAASIRSRSCLNAFKISIDQEL